MILIFCISSWNLFECLCQSAQRRIACNTFFCEAYLWSSIWSLTVEVSFIFIDLCRFSIVDVPASGPENVPKPGLPPYRSPLSAVSSTCKDITWDKCYGSVRLALFTASLTKKCVVWNCALGKGNVFTMRQVSQDRYEFKQKQLLLLKSGAGPVHSIDVLKGDDGIHRQATVNHKDLAHGKRRFQLQLIPPKGPSNNQI